MTADIKAIQKAPSPPAEPGLKEPQIWPSWRKMLLVATGVAALLAIVYLSPLREYHGRLREVSENIRSFGALAPLVLMISVAALVAVGFPRWLFSIIAGMALGFWSGLLWVQLGTLLGNYALFLLARAGGRSWAERFFAKRPRFRQVMQSRGTLGVVLARQLPLPGLVINLACALLPIGHWDFLLGTFVGQLPQAIPFTLIGTGALQPSFEKSIGLVGLAVIASILAWFGIRYALRRASQERASDQTPR